jgi:hypothetical protein
MSDLATVKAAVAVLRATADAIRDLGSVPAGHLYAMAYADKCSAQKFNELVDVLVRAGLVRREASHMLIWIGPEKVK